MLQTTLPGARPTTEGHLGRRRRVAPSSTMVVRPRLVNEIYLNMFMRAALELERRFLYQLADGWREPQPLPMFLPGAALKDKETEVDSQGGNDTVVDVSTTWTISQHDFGGPLHQGVERPGRLMMMVEDAPQSSIVSSTPPPATAPAIKPKEVSPLKKIRDEVVARFAKHAVTVMSQVEKSPAPLARQISNESFVVPARPSDVKLARSVSAQGLMCHDRINRRCSICLSESPTMVMAKNLCPDQCSGGEMCISCANTYWSTHLKETRYVIAPLRCVGCKSAIQFHKWRDGVRPKEATMHMENISAQFTVRCPYCDQDCSFALVALDDAASNDAEARNIQDQLEACFTASADDLSAFRDALEAFLAYEPKAAARVVDAIARGVGNESTTRKLFVPSYFRTADDSSVEGDSILAPLAMQMVVDPERRMTLQLEYWKRVDESRVSTSCCSAPICFGCKNGDGWHQGETCEEVMERMWQESPVKMTGDSDNNDKIFHCPECFVRFVHAGGCSYIRCLCGFEFNLEELWNE